MHPSTRDAKSRPVSSGIGSASMSPRSRIVGPGLEPVEQGHDAARRFVQGDRRAAARRATSSTCSRVTGRSLPSSGHSCSRAAQRDRVVEQVGRVLADRRGRDAVRIGLSVAHVGALMIDMVACFRFCGRRPPTFGGRRHRGRRTTTGDDDVDVRRQSRRNSTNLGNTLTRPDRFDHPGDGDSCDSALNGTTWQGPARERFAGEWNGSFKQALGKLNEAFGIARAGLRRARRRAASGDGRRLSTADAVSTYAGGVVHIEFTIEPFVEGQPGAHVLAAVDAAAAARCRRRDRSVRVVVRRRAAGTSASSSAPSPTRRSATAPHTCRSTSERRNR